MSSSEIYTVDEIEIVLRKECDTIFTIKERLERAKMVSEEKYHIKKHVHTVIVEENSIILTLIEYQNRWVLGGLINEIRKIIDGEAGVMTKKSQIKEIIFH